jgi:NADPH-dependent glutamate synthase beta subunit-like oxidoreductase
MGMSGSDPERILEMERKSDNRMVFGVIINWTDAGGDCMTGPDDAISAIADGKKAAFAIDEYLNKGADDE